MRMPPPSHYILTSEQLAQNEGIALSEEEFKAELIMTFAGPPEGEVDEAARKALAVTNIKVMAANSRLAGGLSGGVPLSSVSEPSTA